MLGRWRGWEGKGLISSMSPLTSCIVLQAMCMIASSRCVSECRSVYCVPTYWQLRDLYRGSFFIICQSFSLVFFSLDPRVCSATVQSRCLEWNALSISIPLCSLHFISSSYIFTHPHTHSPDPISFNISAVVIVCRRRPCHRLNPRDTDPRSARLVLTHRHYKGQRGQ